MFATRATLVSCDIVNIRLFYHTTMLRAYKKFIEAPRELPLILSCEFLDSFASFALDYVLVLFLFDGFEVTDDLAGWIYGLYGMSVMLMGLLFGPLIDNLGVKWSTIVGSILSLCARMSIVFVTDFKFLLVLILALLPAGVSLTSNVFKLGIRRYTNLENRSLAFDLSYFVINCAALSSALLLTLFRIYVKNMDLYRLYLFSASIGCCIQLAIAFSLREMVVDECTEELLYFSIKKENYITIIKEVISSQALWKFVVVSFCICIGVGTIMRHFGSTFPKTFTRFNGAHSPYELILGLNPLIIVCTLPMVSYIRTATKISLYNAILIGSIISTASMFIMAASLSITAAIIALCIFTIGEIMWAPRFIEWSVLVGKEGREGTVIALTGFPKFISRLAAGGVSGFLLDHFCASNELCSHGNFVWLFISVMSTITPLTLWMLKQYLIEDFEHTKNDTAESICDTESTEASEEQCHIRSSLLGYEAKNLWPFVFA